MSLGAVELSPGGQPDRLGAALQRYAVAQVGFAPNWLTCIQDLSPFDL